MSRHPCGDFELTMSANNSSNVDVCHENKIYTQNLPPKSSLELRMWHKQHARVSLRCFIWCTSDGNLPQHSKDDFGNSYIDNLTTILEKIQVLKTNTIIS